MMPNKPTEALNVQDAMDNLAAIASIDLESLPLIGITQRGRLVTEGEEFGPGVVFWLSGEGSEVVLETMETTYRAVHSHLRELFENPGMDWESEKSRKGIAAMMNLVGESAQKMNRYLSYRLGPKYKEKVEEGEAFKALSKFYSERFAKKFSGGIEGAEAWNREWEENEDAIALDTSGSGLKDFEGVKRDREYELFYIRNEEGNPYFTPELLRNIRLTADFDLSAESFEEDPLLKVRTLADRDLHASAKQILGDCYPSIQEFYKIVKQLTDHELAKTLSLAVMSLFLAADSHNLVQNTDGKSAMLYFEDFHRFLRLAMKTSEYQRMIAYPPEKTDKAAHCLLFLIHHLCYAFFHRTGGIKQEAIGLIHRSMRKGEELQSKKGKGETLWSQLLFDDEKFRTLLAKFPNGPMFKILDVVREAQEEDEIIPFDPLAQNNRPCTLFEMSRKDRKTLFLKIPSPTRQMAINKVEIVDEFRGFLRALASSDHKRKHLLINLQDRTSWREAARSRAIEALPKNAEFNSHLFVLTLPKDTDFYHQSNEYLTLNQASDFLSSFRSQILSAEECGFSFPSHWKRQEIERWIDALLPLIHEHCFEKKKTLTRRNREDFIEIVYQFLILKLIDLLEPDSVSFTCKDATDIGASAAASFYAFLKILTGGLTSKEDLDYFRWLMYTQALFVRERAVDPERFGRTLSSLEQFDRAMDAKGEGPLGGLTDLYRPKLFKSIAVRAL